MRRKTLFLDTETTGLTPGVDRICEIGIVELIDGVRTQNNFQTYLNPQRSLHKETLAMTGLTDKFLATKPLFADILSDFLEYIAGAHEIIMHNALFDLNFLNYELSLLGKDCLELTTRSIKDSLALARSLSASGNSLTALCAKYHIEDKRKFHSAIHDAELLSQLFVTMMQKHPDNIYVQQFNDDFVVYKGKYAKDDASFKKITINAYVPSSEDIKDDSACRKFAKIISDLDVMQKRFISSPFYILNLTKKHD